MIKLKYYNLKHTMTFPIRTRAFIKIPLSCCEINENWSKFIDLVNYKSFVCILVVVPEGHYSYLDNSPAVHHRHLLLSPIELPPGGSWQWNNITYAHIKVTKFILTKQTKSYITCTKFNLIYETGARSA